MGIKDQNKRETFPVHDNVLSVVLFTTFVTFVTSLPYLASDVDSVDMWKSSAFLAHILDGWPGQKGRGL